MSITHFLQEIPFKVFDFVLHILFSQDIANVVRELKGEPLIPIHHERIFILVTAILLVFIIRQHRKKRKPLEIVRNWIAQNAHGVIGLFAMFSMVEMFHFISHKVSDAITFTTLILLIVSTPVLYAFIEVHKDRLSFIGNKVLFGKSFSQ